MRTQTPASISDRERQIAKEFVDRVMGQCAGDGVPPSRAAALLAERHGIVLTARQVWNLWIDGDEE